MTAAEFNMRVLLPAIAAFPFADSPEARVLSMAIAGQESGWTYRVQQGDGPGHSFFQFEHGTPASRGGVTGLVMHPVAAPILRQFCSDWEILFDIGEIYKAIVFCDPLAYCCTRLLLWTDPAPLPVLGDQAGAWGQYLSLWRPGKPKPESWPARYAAALGIAVAPASRPIA
jgi:hypothetical protein